MPALPFFPPQMDLHEANQRLAGGGEKGGPVTPAESQFAAAQAKEVEKQKATIEEQRKKIEEIRGDLEARDKEAKDLDQKVKTLEEQVSHVSMVGGCVFDV